MSASGLLPVPAAARRAWDWLPALTRSGRVFVGPCGELLRVADDGSIDFVHQGGAPYGRSVAADPVPGRRVP